MKKQFYTLAVLFLMGFAAEAQVGIGTSNPNSSSMLDITSTTKGLLMPRLTTVQRLAVPTPATGLQVYDLTTNSFWYFNGTVWINTGTASSTNYWTLAGTNLYNNSGINVGVGTTAPIAKLHIAADVSNYRGQLVVGGISDPDNKNKIVEIGYNTTSNQGFIQPSWSGTQWSDLLLNPNNAGQGYVGINTTTPHGQLALGNLLMNRKIVLYETTNNDHAFMGFGVNNAALRYQVESINSDHIFFAGASATTSNELMRIKGGGNVGIGTSIPSGKLHIAADKNDFGEFAQLMVTGADINKKLLLGYNSTTNKGFIQSVFTGTSFTDLLLQPTAGNVGIGITSAGHKLSFDNTTANIAKIALLEFGSTNSMGLGTGPQQFRLNVGSTGDRFSFLSSEAATSDIMTLKGNGELIVSNTVTAPRIQGPSDFRFKKNIKPIENALDKVLKLGGYTYDWRDASEFPKQSLGKGHDMGVIAQEVEKQFPEAVTTNADGYKAVSYTELVPALIEAIKAQQIQINIQQVQINKLQLEVKQLKK